MRSIEILKI